MMKRKLMALFPVAFALVLVVAGAGVFAQSSWQVIENDVMITGRVLALGGYSGPERVADTQVVGVLTGRLPHCSYGGTVPISSTANTGVTVTAPALAGIDCTLVNVGAFTITITDTGILKLSGNAVLTPDDTLGLKSLGGNWYETFNSAN